MGPPLFRGGHAERGVKSLATSTLLQWGHLSLEVVIREVALEHKTTNKVLQWGHLSLEVVISTS